MNELKWYWAFDPYLDPPEKQKESAQKAGYVKVVNKSDADKVIAELEEKLDGMKWRGDEWARAANDKDKQIAELKKEKEYVVEQTAEVINGQERELQHHKYKRCLAMAKLCQWKMGVFIYKKEKNEFYYRWHKRWLTLADKYKDGNV